MERPKNSKVQHGRASCARYGCKRPECLEARRREKREVKRDLSNGIHARVSAFEASAYLQHLVNSGLMSPIDIAQRSGVHATRVRRILRGADARIHRTTAEALLGVSVPAEWGLLAGDAYIDATGTQRRLQALSVQGFPLPTLTVETELTKSTIRQLRSGNRARVMLSGMRTVKAVHDRLWDEDPTALGVPDSVVKKTKTWAAKSAWHPTEAWSDIDDPSCTPVVRVPRYVALTEDANELIEEQGYTRRTAAERMGVEKNTLDSAMAYYNKVMAEAP